VGGGGKGWAGCPRAVYRSRRIARRITIAVEASRRPAPTRAFTAPQGPSSGLFPYSGSSIHFAFRWTIWNLIAIYKKLFHYDFRYNYRIGRKIKMCQGAKKLLLLDSCIHVL